MQTNDQPVPNNLSRFLIIAFILHTLMFISFKVAVVIPPAKTELQPAINAIIVSKPTKDKPDTASSIAAEHQHGKHVISQQFSSQEPQPTTKDPADIKTTPPQNPSQQELAAIQDEMANYISQWQHYVEEYGNTNFPKQITSSKLSGKLRLLVKINKDGSLQDIQIFESSGQSLIDKAAIDIVRDAAPFSPLPHSLSNQQLPLTIMRTWEFNEQSRNKS